MNLFLNSLSVVMVLLIASIGVAVLGDKWDQSVLLLTGLWGIAFGGTLVLFIFSTVAVLIAWDVALFLRRSPRSPKFLQYDPRNVQN